MRKLRVAWGPPRAHISQATPETPMTFQITGLPMAGFAPLFDLPSNDLAARGARRLIADSSPGFPCRVSLEDADVGATVILTGYDHLTGRTPFAARHAIYVRAGAEEAGPAPGQVPRMLTTRILSLRAFDADGMMLGAKLSEGADTASALTDLMTDETAFVDIHFAAPGCFAARARPIRRWGTG